MRAYAALALLLVMVLGCGSEIPVYPVKGKVTFEGKPMPAGGSITLVPLTDQPGKTAAGEIGPDGGYRLTTHADGDGSMAGEFRVVIHQVVDQEPQRMSSGEEEAVTIPPPLVAPADRIPGVYSDPRQSPLRANVEANSFNEINFDLKRNPQ